MTKITFITKEAKDTFKWFGALSLGILILSDILIVYDGLTRPSIFPSADLIILLFGIVSFALGLAIANRMDLNELKKRLNY